MIKTTPTKSLLKTQKATKSKVITQHKKTHKSGNSIHKKYNPNKFIQHTMDYLASIKMYHWTTKSYQAHKSTDKLHGKLQALMDSYVETSLGHDICNKKTLKTAIKNIRVKTLHNNRDLHKHTRAYKGHMKSVRDELEKNNADEIISIIDEIIAELDVLSYLNTLE